MTRTDKIPLPADQLDPVLRRLQVRAFQHLLKRGQPMTVDDLPAEEHNAVDELRQRGRLTVTTEGHISGSLGLTVVPTRHRMVLAEGIRFTWCALDAISIVPALRRTATVISEVPDAAETITVTYRHGRLSTAPSDAVVLIPGEPQGPVVETWCPFANLFPHMARASSWARHRGLDDYTILDLPDAIDEGTPLWTVVLEGEFDDDPDPPNAGDRC
jgi:hypothetical protein